MDRERVRFRKGPSNTLPTIKVPGTLLIETDTGNAFVDVTTSQRVQLTDTNKLNKSGGTITGDINFGTELTIKADGTLQGNTLVLQQWGEVIPSSINWIDY